MRKAISLRSHGQAGRFDQAASASPYAYAFGSGEYIELVAQWIIIFGRQGKSAAISRAYMVGFVRALEHREQ
jgi:hypothetical protein